MRAGINGNPVMSDISLIEAWRLWWSGASVLNFSLLGIPVLWLGRGGKFIEFIGAATVVADIIGPDKLRAFATQLRGLVALRNVWPNLKNSARWCMHFYSSFQSPTEADLREKRVSWAEIKGDPFSYLSPLIALTMGILAWYFSPFRAIWVKLPLSIIATYLSTVTLGPLGVLLIVGSFNILTCAIAVLVLKPVATLLDLSALKIWIQLFALMCLVIGFLFDFLAS